MIDARHSLRGRIGIRQFNFDELMAFRTAELDQHGARELRPSGGQAHGWSKHAMQEGDQQK